MGKTYKKMSTDISKSKKNQKRIYKKFRFRNELKGVIYDYENEKELPELFEKIK